MATPASEQVVWHSAVEGLYVRALAARMTLPLKTDLRALGLDLDREIPPGLPRDIWYACLHATARRLLPGLPHDEGLRQLGRWTVEGISRTIWGRALSRGVPILGVRRLLLRFPWLMRSTNNFATGEMRELGPTTLGLKVTDAGDAPQMVQGSLEQLARWAGARRVDVKLLPETAPAASFSIEWSV